MKFLNFYFLFFVFSASGKSYEVHEILYLYQKKDSVRMDIKKTFVQPLLKKKTVSFGKFYLNKNIWRLDIEKPNKNSVIFDGKSLVYVSGSGSHQKIPPQSSALELIWSPESFKKVFKYKNKSQKGRTQIYHFEGQTLSAPNKISIQIEENRILSLYIKWEDPPLGEEMYQFSSIQFSSPIQKDIFKVNL